MTEGSTHFCSSPILKLDVGGKVFKVTKPSIDRFPKSLLAELVAACPGALANEKPLFIDRSPIGFEVILEIYRYAWSVVRRFAEHGGWPVSLTGL